jgi:hypothetical protein
VCAHRDSHVAGQIGGAEPETPFEDLLNDEIPWDPMPEPAWGDLRDDDIPFSRS